jgi:hypothetical protein
MFSLSAGLEYQIEAYAKKNLLWDKLQKSEKGILIFLQYARQLVS